MGKKPRKRAKGGPLDTVSRGLVPWSVDGFNEVVKFENELRVTPVDDWDLTEAKMGLYDDRTGDLTEYKLNKFKPEVQVANFILGKYPNFIEGTAHWHRYDRIRAFLGQNLDRLKAERWVIETAGGLQACTALLQALCELPFSKRLRGRGVNAEYTFSLEEVVERTRRLSAKG